MHAKLLASALLTVVFIATGCTPLTRRTSLTEQGAIALAVKLANQEALTRFKAAPFTADSGDLRLVEGRWRWQALTNVKGADAVARITFDHSGGRPEVYVDLQHSAVSKPPGPKPLPELKEPGAGPPRKTK